MSSDIIYVGASDGATVVATKLGDIFALHEYKCRKIVSRLLLIQKIVVIGGHLNAKMSSDILVEKSGNELKVLVLQSTGNIYIWQETYPQVTRCIFNLNLSLLLKDVELSLTQIFFVADDGEAFRGEFKTRKKKHIESVSPVTSGKNIL